MKINIFTTLFFSFLLSISVFFMPSLAFGQDRDLSVVLVPIKSEDDVRVLYPLSTHPMDYYIGKNVAQPVFLTMITQNQKSAIEKLGYIPQIIDTTPGELGQYYTMSAVKPNAIQTLQDPSLKTLGVELAVPINEYEMLIKLSPGKTIRDIHSPRIDTFESRKFAFDMKLPQQLSNGTITSVEPPKKSIPNPFPMFFSFVIPLAIIYLIYRPRKSTKKIK